MKPLTFVWKTSASLLLYTTLVSAQGQAIPAIALPSPSQTWNPVAVCTNGLANPNDPNGIYTDVNGAQWAIRCGQTSDGTQYDTNQGTNGQGVTACMNGCDNRPGCTAWGFQGTVNSATVGSGKCFYKYGWGTTYSSDSTWYASAELIAASPQKPCPYWNQSTYVDTSNNVWQVSCGYDSSASSQTFSGAYHGSMESCMTQCDALTGCDSFSYNYGGAENTNPPPGTCYMKSGSRVSGRSVAVNVALRIGSAVPGQPYTSLTSSSSSSVSPYTGPTTTRTTTTQTTTTTTTSQSTTTTTTTYPTTTTTSTTTSQTTTTTTLSSSSTSGTANPTATCTLAPVPSAPVCPGSNGQSFINSCGTNYTVYCGYDTTPGSVKTVNANSLHECSQQCDNYAGCKAITLGGTACYLKTSFSATTGGGTAGVNSLVRYIPPNPNFAVPPQAPCQNCSSGCGIALMSGYVAGGSTVNIANVVGPDGKARAIAIHIPKFYDPNRASPLIFGFPGNADDAAGIESQTGMSDGTVNPYGVMVYVTGYNKGFQSNPDWSALGLDDVGFVNYLITNMTSQYCIDTGRIFATGHSNGGGFTNMLACDPVMSVKFAAFAFNSGACYTSANSGNPSTIEPVNTPDQAQCAPGRSNVPWLEIHGTADGTIDYQGGVRRGKLLPTLPHLATAWAVRQGLSSNNYTTVPATGATEYQFGGDIGQLGMVTHYRLDNWGHDWAKVSGGAPLDSTPIIMNFFYRWSDSNRAALEQLNGIDFEFVVFESFVELLFVERFSNIHHGDHIDYEYDNEYDYKYDNEYEYKHNYDHVILIKLLVLANKLIDQPFDQLLIFEHFSATHNDNDIDHDHLYIFLVFVKLLAKQLFILDEHFFIFSE